MMANEGTTRLALYFLPPFEFSGPILFVPVDAYPILFSLTLTEVAKSNPSKKSFLKSYTIQGYNQGW